ncbi:hypothetical protein BGZ68_004936 [Mortierella alpina]|nr:hypothetical protein BGZ68_004936 [Mortierella alpina]
MGLLRFICVTYSGSRLIGMSYENYEDADPSLLNEQFVVLVQSNPNPTAENIHWSLLAVTERLTSFPQDHSPLVCNVDQKTGVFSLMSNFSDSSSPETVINPRPPGGFQYDPRTNVWSNFTLAPGYRWGNVDSTFDLFQWPNTDTLVQVNIGASNNSVNLGILETGQNGARQFVNAGSWSLDPHIYGYPRQLVYTKDAIFQFGSFVNNNATGSLRYILTKIPLSGTPQTFKPPAQPEIYNATSLSRCDSRNLVPKYYKGTLYMFCQTSERNPAGLGMAMKDEVDPAIGFSAPTYIVIPVLPDGLIQPMGDKENGTLFGFTVDANYFPVYAVDLKDSEFGDPSFLNEYPSIPEPYGTSLTFPPNHLPAIIGGSVAGALVLLALVLFFVFRRRWPVWKRKLGARIVEMMMKDQEGHNGKDDKDGVYKIEDTSRSHSFDEDIGDKILVTEDMEASLVSLERGYMSEVPLQRHPRPGVVTTLVTDSTSRPEDDDTETLGGDSRSGSEGRGRSRGSMGSSRASLLQRRSSLERTPSTRALSPPSATLPARPTPALLDPTQATIAHPSILSLPLAASARTQHPPTAPELYTRSPSTSSGGFHPWHSPSSYAPADSQIARSALGNTPSLTIDAADDGMELAEVAPPYIQSDPDLSMLHRPSFPAPPTPTAPVFVLEELRNYEGTRPRSPAAILDEQDIACTVDHH